MFKLHILLNFLLALIFTGLFNPSFSQDRNIYNQPCVSVIPNRPVTLTVAESNIKFDYTKSSSELAEMSEFFGNDSEKKGYSKKFHNHGFTGTEILISVESDAQGLYLIPNKWPSKDYDQPKLMCFKTGVNVKLSFEQFTVYVAKNFTDNRCIFDSIKKHELMHAKLFEENLNKLGEEIRQYALIKTQGKIFYVENSQIFDGKSLAVDINNYGKKRWDEMKSSHNPIDEIYTFDALKKDCNP